MNVSFGAGQRSTLTVTREWPLAPREEFALVCLPEEEDGLDLVRACRLRGVPIRLVESLDEVVNWVRRIDFRVVLVSWPSPDEVPEGYYAAIKETAIYNPPSVILSLHNPTAERVLDAVRSGADDVLGSPFDPEDFLAKIERLIVPQS